MIKLGMLTIEFHPLWLNNRVIEMGKTSWYIEMHKKGDSLLKTDTRKEYNEFVDSCKGVRLYSNRMDDLLF